MNRSTLLLIVSDIFVLTGFGLVQPILAIFIKDDLVGGTIFAAGLASMMFIITKSVVQMPLSKVVDRHQRSFRRRILIIGTFVLSVVPFIYIIADHVNYIYIAQVVEGVGSGLAYPAWVGIWSRSSDINHRSFDWSLYSTLTGIGTGLAALTGAGIAQFFGFTYAFLVVGAMSLFGCIILFKLDKQ
jgi:predicted MFS family arabinose efflux permease